MTPSEFKAWFEGFTESMDGPPSLKHWEKIQARVKQITGHPVSYPVFVDRYWTQPHQWWQSPVYPLTVCQNSMATLNSAPETAARGVKPVDWQNIQIGGTGLGPDGHMAKFSRDLEGVGYSTLNAGHCDGTVGAVAFDSHSAMNALGKADAADLAA